MPSGGTGALARALSHRNARLFFGASATLAATLERIGESPGTLVLELSGVPLADSSASASLKTFVDQARRHGAEVIVAGAPAEVRHVLVRSGLKVPLVRYSANVAEARLAAGSPTAP